MANAHSFPLLRLPFLALETIVKQMAVGIQFDLSTLSKRAEWVVRASTLKQKICLEFSSYSSIGDIEVGIKHSKSDSYQRIKLHKASLFPTSLEMKEVITKISSVFKNLGVLLNIHNSIIYRMMFNLVPFIKQLNITLDSITVSSSFSDDELCKHALEAAKDARKLRIFCSTSDDFQPPELGATNLEYLDIRSSSWVTLDHLFNNFLNCSVIELRSSKMTIHDVNGLLKSWVQGSSMRTFRWMPTTGHPGEPILQRVLEGIPRVAVERATVEKQDREFRDGSCFMIEQVGGAKAIVWEGFVYLITMTTEFSLD